VSRRSMFSLALSSGVGISVLQFYYARVMSRSCCGVAELNGVIRSCEGFVALIRCTVQTTNWRHITRYGGEFTSNVVVAGEKRRVRVRGGTGRDRDWKTTVIVFVKAKETRSC
jgi:hypothetical protein